MELLPSQKLTQSVRLSLTLIHKHLALYQECETTHQHNLSLNLKTFISSTRSIDLICPIQVQPYKKYCQLSGKHKKPQELKAVCWIKDVYHVHCSAHVHQREGKTQSRNARHPSFSKAMNRKKDNDEQNRPHIPKRKALVIVQIGIYIISKLLNMIA